MASREESRKRLKVSPTRSIPTGKPSKPATTTSSMAAPPDILPSQHEQTLMTLTTDIEAMRQLVTCKICDRLLYEPFALACGHTYCYSCLSQWLVSNKKKTCPDCRADVTEQPTPSYIVRELVLIFANRKQLLPEGETTEEHLNLAREEAKIVADDRANTDLRTGGLFKGRFSTANRRTTPIHDHGDGVPRCPECLWEVEDGYCWRCDLGVDGWSESDFTDYLDDEDEDVSIGEGLDGFNYFSEHDPFVAERSPVSDGGSLADQVDADIFQAIHGPRRRRSGHPVSISSDSEDDSDYHGGESDEEGNLPGFVVGDDTVEHESDDGEDTDVPQVVATRRLARRGAPVVISDDEDETDISSVDPDHGAHRFDTADDEDEEDDEEDDEDATPVPRTRTVVKRGPNQPRQRTRVVSSDDESDESSDDDEAEQYYDVPPPQYDPSETSADDGYSELGDYRREDEAHVESEDGYSEPSEAETFLPSYHDHTEETEETGESEDSDGGEWCGPQSSRGVVGDALLIQTTGRYPRRSADSLASTAARPSIASNSTTARPSVSANSMTARPSIIANSTTARPSMSAPRMPPHPFNLEDTLIRANYNERAQRGRPRTRVDASSNDGTAQESSRPLATPRRKRALSIESDEASW